MEKQNWIDEKQKIIAVHNNTEREFTTNPEHYDLWKYKKRVIIELSRKEIAFLLGMTKEGVKIYFDKKFLDSNKI